MTVDKVIRILENTKKIEKTETVEIDKMIEMLKDLKQNQINYKTQLLSLLKVSKRYYEKTKGLDDYVRILTYESAIEFFESYIEKEW